MFDKLKYIGLQKVLNQVNQMHKVSADGTVGESLYTKICLEKILSVFTAHFENPNGHKILDGGCGTGTMTVELAQAGYALTGIEIHKPSLEMGRQRAHDQGVDIQWVSGDLLSSLQGLPSDEFSAVICMGVLYTCPQYQEIIAEFSRVLKNDGIFIGTFRSKFYFITTLLRQKQFDKALYVAQNSEGLLKLASIPSYYNWQTPKEVTSLYSQNKLELLKMTPVGVFSGAGYDGLAAIVDVDELSNEEIHSGLYELESSEWDDCLGAGRFMMAVGKKSNSLSS